MLDERDWQQIGAPEGNLIQAMKDYQNRYGVSLAVAKEEAPKEILARYKELTGFEETNVYALYHGAVRASVSGGQRCTLTKCCKTRRETLTPEHRR